MMVSGDGMKCVEGGKRRRRKRLKRLRRRGRGSGDKRMRGVD